MTEASTPLPVPGNARMLIPQTNVIKAGAKIIHHGMISAVITNALSYG